MSLVIMEGSQMAIPTSMPDEGAAVIGRRALIGAALAAAAAAPAWPASQSARDFVEAIYRAYRTPSEMSASGEGVAIDNPREVRRLFAPDIAALIIADERAAAKNGDEGALDGDPFVDAQDWKITGVNVDISDIGPDHAMAQVNFANFGKATQVKLELVRLKSGWRIRDITWPEGTLRALYAGAK
jgi:hypothetical protein